MTSFGVPAPYGKFYPGRLEDSPVNHDLLWRTQCKAEDALLSMYEQRNRASVWNDDKDRKLLTGLRKHGGGQFARWMDSGQGDIDEEVWVQLLADPDYKDITSIHSTPDCEHRVRLLQREQNQDLPPTEPTGLRGELVATQKARKSQQTLQRMQDMLRKERAAATAQAMRLAKETKFRRNMEQRLEKLQKILHGQQVSELTHSRGKRPRARGKPMATQPAPGSPANGAAAGHAVLYNDAARRLDDLLDSKRLQRIGRTSMRHSASGRRSTPGKHIEYQRPSTSHSATCRRIAAVGNGAGVPADSSRASQRPRSSAGHRRKPRSASRERRHRGRTDDRRRKRGGHYRRSQSEHYLVPIADHASALPSGLRGRFGEALEKSMAARARAAMAVKERS